jgi:RimJ/RimL family protein N-acetyltransferase
MELRGTRCLIRAWHPGDEVALARHANNKNVARQLRDRFPHPYTIADGQRFIRSVAGATPPTILAIVVDEPCGGIGFSAGTDVERYSAEIGYWLGEAYWGQGIAAEALTLVSRYAFEHCGLLRLFALPFADNVQSIRVLEKAGYSREGIMVASSVKHGVIRDQALYALVNPNWQRR